MFLFWSGFSGSLPVAVGALEESDVLFGMSGCSLVVLISTFFGNDDMGFVFGVVDLEGM